MTTFSNKATPSLTSLLRLGVVDGRYLKGGGGGRNSNSSSGSAGSHGVAGGAGGSLSAIVVIVVAIAGAVALSCLIYFSFAYFRSRREETKQSRAEFKQQVRKARRNVKQAVGIQDGSPGRASYISNKEDGMPLGQDIQFQCTYMENWKRCKAMTTLIFDHPDPERDGTLSFPSGNVFIQKISGRGRDLDGRFAVTEGLVSWPSGAAYWVEKQSDRLILNTGTFSVSEVHEPCEASRGTCVDDDDRHPDDVLLTKTIDFEGGWSASNGVSGRYRSFTCAEC